MPRTNLRRPTCRIAAWRPLRLAACLSAAFALSACAYFAGPDYQRPDSPAKSGWSLNTETPAKGSETIQMDWWTAFGDPYLNELIERAIANNISIQIAAARVAEAAAFIGTAEAARIPSLTGNAGFEARTQGAIGGPGRPVTDTSANAGAALGWEIDIWGKLKKGIQAEQANYHASEADWRAVWLLTASDVAAAYFFIRQLDSQVVEQTKSLEVAERILATNTAQASVGLKTATDVLTQQAEVHFIRTGLLDLQRQRTLAENALATLLGTPAGEVHVPVAKLEDTLDAPSVPQGLPADLLSRRPDILAAEYRVLSAHELVGQARLAQLPSIKLNIDGGARNLLSSAIASWTFGIGPSIEIPIFNPDIRARIKTSEARENTVEQEYRQTVITAFQEVEDALVNLKNHREQREQIRDRVQQLEEVAARTRTQMEQGAVSQLQLLETERTLRNASLDRLRNHQEILADTITLYKALGGGWPPIEVKSDG